MMESLFGCNSVNSVPNEVTKKSVCSLVEKENRVLDPKKSQNIAIMLRALNVTKDEVSDALLDGMCNFLLCINKVWFRITKVNYHERSSLVP